MEDVYIPTYRNYGHTDAPLAFFTYIADSFGRNINGQINEIVQDTGVAGSAMPVDLFIDMVQNYAENGFNHLFIRNVFSVNREVRLADISLNEQQNYQYENHEEDYLLAAEPEPSYRASQSEREQ